VRPCRKRKPKPDSGEQKEEKLYEAKKALLGAFFAK
jgi:hypothetical protein